MGLAYAPFEDEKAPKPPALIHLPDGTPLAKISLPASDNTECNYVVMFFVIGVFLIAITDSMRGK
jgi:hypothetical protein